MSFNAQGRKAIRVWLTAVVTGIRNAAEKESAGERELIRLLTEAIQFAEGPEDVVTVISLDQTLARIETSIPFRSVSDIEVVLPHFGGGVVATTILPTESIVPERLTVRDALQSIRRHIESDIVDMPFEQSTMVLPEEKVAPFHYSFDDDRLVVHQQPVGVALEGTIASARKFLLEQGAQLITDLRKLNSDRRLPEAFEALQQKLSDGHDIIQLGLLNITCEGVVGAVETEISEILAAVLRGHTVGVRHYLAQFPEWVQFSDSAAELEVTREDLASLTTAVAALAEALEKQASVDEAVPRSLRSLANLHIDNRMKLRQIGLALVRTLESLARSVFRRTVSFAGKTLDRTLDAASKLIAGGLAPVIAITVIHIGATVLESTGAEWLQPAARVILRSEEKLLGK